MKRCFGSVQSQVFRSIGEGFRSRQSLDNTTSQDLFTKNFEGLGRSAYAGFDPTSDKLHLGNMLQVVALVRASLFGFRPIFLVGGATGKIGDPSGKSAERNLLEDDLVEANKAAMMRDLSNVVSNLVGHVNSKADEYGIHSPLQKGIVLDNLVFYKDFNVLRFLSEVGRHMRVSVLLGRDSVSSRLKSQEGISYTEFSYQLLQAYDFLHLFRKENCVLQLGGSDQWGNIASGIDLVRKADKATVYGITSPLLLTQEGKKFGKSEGNAIWMTSETEDLLGIYQYLINLPDEMLEPLLFRLTFLREEEILAAMKAQQGQPELNFAKKLLAKEVISYITGSSLKYESVSNYSLYFGLDFSLLKQKSAEELRQQFATMLNCVRIKRSDLGRSANVYDLLKLAGVRPSISKLDKLAKMGGLRLNDAKVNPSILDLEEYPAIADTLLVVKSGKKEYFTILLD